MNPTPRVRRPLRIVIQAIIVGITALILLATGNAIRVLSAPDPEAGPAAELMAPHDATSWRDYSPLSEDPELDTDTVWGEINAAMRENDREGFLNHASGDAKQQLAGWWDNTKKIGWETGYVEPLDETASKMRVLVGLDLPFSAKPLRGSGDDEGGLSLLHGFQYEITTAGGEDEFEITSFTPLTPMPWDDGELYVVHRDHVVLYGLADERALVDATADAAESSAQLALTKVQELGAEVPQHGFVSGVTDDNTRFLRWHGEDNGWEDDIAGFMRATHRPAAARPYIDPVVATGSGTSGGSVIMGPNSADSREKVFLHEFSHALHFTAVPEMASEEYLAGVEGFARYMERRSGLNTTPWVTPEIQERIAKDGVDLLTKAEFESEDGYRSYDIAASYYAFFEEKGGDPWLLAVEAKSDASTLPGAARRFGDQYSPEAWMDWIAAQ